MAHTFDRDGQMADTHEDHVRRAAGLSADGMTYDAVAAHFNLNHIRLEGAKHEWTARDIRELLGVQDPNDPTAVDTVDAPVHDGRSELEILRSIEAIARREATAATIYREKSLWNLRAIAIVVVAWALLSLASAVLLVAWSAAEGDNPDSIFYSD